MNILIITAMPEESRAVRAILENVRRDRVNGLPAWRGVCGSHQIVVAESGMGFDNAARAAGDALNRISADLIISAGFCGALTSNLATGDTVIADRLSIAAENRLTGVPSTLAELPGLSETTPSDEKISAGHFLSTRRMLPKRELTPLLPADTETAVVEMESSAIARIAAERNIPFIALRSVSDPLHEELDFSLEDFCDRNMRISIPRVLLTIARSPRIIPQLIRLSRNSRIAANSLTRSMARLLAQL